jgi:exodeoxyribonuclease V alpha subunit
MNLAQRFARIFTVNTNEVAATETAQAFGPVANVLWSAVAEGQVALAREAMFERMGPDWDEQAALESDAVQVETGSNSLDGRPIVFGFGHWYLQRYAAIEQRIAKAIHELNVPLSIRGPTAVDFKTDATLNLQQQHAMQHVLMRRLLVLTGGPGTGKTFTLVAIVNALRYRSSSIRIAACAPTGKAALRLGSQVTGLSSVATIHRLLRQPRSDLGYLDFDLVIVDEASMLDAVLADEFLQAIGPDTQLILAGDQNQLSSVRAGAVFSQLCSMQSATVELIESVRFNEQSVIGRLASAVLKNKIDSNLVDSIEWVSSAETHDAVGERTINREQNAWLEALRVGYAPLMNAIRATPVVDNTKAAELLGLLKMFGVLVPTHEGPVGTRVSHEYLRQLVKREPTALFHGRVIAITQNDESTGLRNGDIGLIVNTEHGLRAVFDLGQSESSLSWLLPIALPAHDDGWVLTVHKSQGSEYQSVLLALPPIGSPQSRRELVYTAITRAKESIRLFGTIEQLSAAARMTSERAGGLLKRLTPLES